MITQIAIVGGTHGNERVGVNLIKLLENQLKTYSTFSIQTLIGNPKAVVQNTRFIDTDLNRCFLPQDIQNKDLTLYEHLRAKEMKKLLGDKDNPKTDFIIDIHSSTANMGQTLIVEYLNPVILRLCAFLCQNVPETRILLSDIADSDYAQYVGGLNYNAINLEVGPVMQGISDHVIFEKTSKILNLMLDTIERWNGQAWPASDFSVETYIPYETITYPIDESTQLPMLVHKSVDSYKELKTGDPLFVTIQGKIIPFKGETSYPVFVKEAAYLNDNIAMILTRKQTKYVNFQ